ncbi:hypothetical protein HRbin12_01717 [bacterium HR12]|nr:hypothetical protein HRbin12_01717 [bacterium HR12]
MSVAGTSNVSPSGEMSKLRLTATRLIPGGGGVSSWSMVNRTVPVSAPAGISRRTVPVVGSMTPPSGPISFEISTSSLETGSQGGPTRPLASTALTRYQKIPRRPGVSVNVSTPTAVVPISSKGPSGARARSIR